MQNLSVWVYSAVYKVIFGFKRAKADVKLNVTTGKCRFFNLNKN